MDRSNAKTQRPDLIKIHRAHIGRNDFERKKRQWKMYTVEKGEKQDSRQFRTACVFVQFFVHKVCVFVQIFVHKVCVFVQFFVYKVCVFVQFFVHKVCVFVQFFVHKVCVFVQFLVHKVCVFVQFFVHKVCVFVQFLVHKVCVFVQFFVHKVCVFVQFFVHKVCVIVQFFVHKVCVFVQFFVHKKCVFVQFFVHKVCVFVQFFVHKVAKESLGDDRLCSWVTTFSNFSQDKKYLLKVFSSSLMTLRHLFVFHVFQNYIYPMYYNCVNLLSSDSKAEPLKPWLQPLLKTGHNFKAACMRT